MRILICDDDELIRRQIHKFLRDYFKNAHLPCPEVVMYENGELLLKDTGEKDILFLNVKPNKELHGFGMKSVARIVRKYLGEMHYYYDNDTATFHVIMIVKDMR